jgi:hypothetical protein
LEISAKLRLVLTDSPTIAVANKEINPTVTISSTKVKPAQ